MTAARILNQAQAEAVYSAMCALNKVGCIQGDLTLNEGLRVQWLKRMTVRDGLSGPREEYAEQFAFAAAYGLDGKEPRTAVYTAGIGWQVQDRHGRRGNFETEAEALAS